MGSKDLFVNEHKVLLIEYYMKVQLFFLYIRNMYKPLQIPEAVILFIIRICTSDDIKTFYLSITTILFIKIYQKTIDFFLF